MFAVVGRCLCYRSMFDVTGRCFLLLVDVFCYGWMFSITGRCLLLLVDVFCHE